MVELKYSANKKSKRRKRLLFLLRLFCQPKLCLFDAHSYNIFFCVFAFCATVDVEKIQSPVRLKKALFIAVFRTVIPKGNLLYKRRAFCVVNFFTNNLFHFFYSPFGILATDIVQCKTVTCQCYIVGSFILLRRLSFRFLFLRSSNRRQTIAPFSCGQARKRWARLSA